MKKLLIMLSVLIMILSFSACKGPDKDDVDSNQTTSTTQQQENQETEDKFVETQPTGDETNDVPPTGSEENVDVETGESSINSNDGQHTHTYKKIVTNPTCDKDGFTTYSCDCGTKYTDDTILATGHKYGEWKEIKAATETAVGKESRKCKNCNKTEERNIPKIIKGHTHQYNSSVTKAATCESDGVKTFTCSCGASYTETIGKTAHNYSKTVIKPTCTTPGYTKNTCKCGKTYYDENVNATGHNYKSKVTAATCTNKGYTTYTCSVCNNSYTGNEKSALGHKYKDSVVAPTCTNSGYTTHTCSACGHYYTDNKTSATGHKNIKTSTTPATCGTDGSKKEVCGVCNATIKTTTIPATGKHNYVAKTCAEAYKEVVNTGESVTTQNLASYQHKTDWMCNICSNCHKIKQGSDGDIWSKYSNKEACEIMLGYVNDLRKEYKAANPGFYHATDKVTLVYDEKLTELANIRAKELATSYSHDTGTRTGAYECIGRGQNTIQTAFEKWMQSNEHHNIMIHKNGAKFGYGRYIDPNGTVYNCLLIWEAGWSAELWEMKYGN